MGKLGNGKFLQRGLDIKKPVDTRTPDSACILSFSYGFRHKQFVLESTIKYLKKR